MTGTLRQPAACFSAAVDPAGINICIPSATTAPARPRAARTAEVLTDLPGGVLDGGEIIHFAVKPSLWRPMLDSLGWLVLSVLGAVMTISWGLALPGVSSVLTGQLLLLLGFTRLAVALIRWIPTWYVLTNRRVLTVRGVRTPHIASLALSCIARADLYASIPEKVLRLGTISIVAAEPEGVTHFWHSLSRCEVVYDQLQQAIRNASGPRSLRRS